MLRRRFLQCVLASGVNELLATPTPVFAQGAPRDATAGRTRLTRMDEGRPSITAQSTATLRAAHQLLDQPRILDDPLALRIIGREAESAVRADPQRDARLATLRAFVVLRSRYAEDELTRAIQRGVRQYVILGAGLDTFAYRSPHGARLRVFEVDHPATQSWKRERLDEGGIKIPGWLTFAPIDFEKQTLADGLRQAVASLSSGSEIVFDYAVPPAALSESERATHEVLARRVAAIGEPWITYFDPLVLASELRQIGSTHLEGMGPNEANDRYFKNRSDGLRVGSVAHLMKAGL
jgi:O-methyltransferase involved in polyketide biosynthesis